MGCVSGPALERCDQCAAVRCQKAFACVRCWGIDFTPIPSSGEGRVVAATVARRLINPAGGPLPYAIALIQLAEGPRVIAHASWSEQPPPPAGSPVKVCETESRRLEFRYRS